MDININKLKKAMKSNKTFDMFITICCQYNICIFEHINGTWMLRNNKSLLEECKKKRMELYRESIQKMGSLMKSKMDYIQEKIELETMMEDLKQGIKNLDLLGSLLEDIYNDKCLNKMAVDRPKRTGNKVILIEHYSNST